MSTDPGRRSRWELPGPEDPGDIGLPRPNRKLVYGLLLVVVALILLRVFTGGSSTPRGPITRSCTRAAFVLSATTVQAGGTVDLTVTGPPMAAYVVLLDATHVQQSGGLTRPTPADAPVLQGFSSLDGCEQAGAVRIPASTPAGQHTVALFDDRPGADAGPIQTVAVTVQGSGR